MPDAMPESSAAPAVQPPTQASSAPPPGDWRSSLSEDLRGDKTLASVKGTTWDEVGPTLAKMTVESQKLIGRNGLTVPKDDAKPEEWAKFYGAIGRPETPDKYELIKPEKLPDGLAWRPELEAKARSVAHSVGLTPRQFNAVVDLYNEVRLRELDEAETYGSEERAKAEEALGKAWGPKDGPRFRLNVGKAKEVVAKVFGNDPDLMAAAEAMGNNAAWVRGLVEKIAPLVLEEGLIHGDPLFSASRDELTRQIAEVRAELGKGATGLRRRDLDNRLRELYKQRDGTQEITGPNAPFPVSR